MTFFLLNSDSIIIVGTIPVYNSRRYRPRSFRTVRYHFFFHSLDFKTHFNPSSDQKGGLNFHENEKRKKKGKKIITQQHTTILELDIKSKVHSFFLSVHLFEGKNR